MISVTEIFKITVGPSSSHTAGPMTAANLFIRDVPAANLAQISGMKIEVFGSLSFTGRGHGSDCAILMGLCGFVPRDVDIDTMPKLFDAIKKFKKIPLLCENLTPDPEIPDIFTALKPQKIIDFCYEKDFIFHKNFLPQHENALKITAFLGSGAISETYFSIGGGAVVTQKNFGKRDQTERPVPHPYESAADIISHCQQKNLSSARMMLENELALCDENALRQHIFQIFFTMQSCIQRGLETDGVLPGVLRLQRRAKSLHQILKNSENDELTAIDWVNLYALAVNEENAAGGRVVTAPTNGACGIVPAVLMYMMKFIFKNPAPDPKNPEIYEILQNFFLIAALIGSLYKKNASISGAEVGCQGEVGVACSMAAGALAGIMGGDVETVCTAAEIAMEHNLGLTCDPIAGLVQIPCIERNAIAAVKAINAARMAMKRTTKSTVRLDCVIKAMFETGKDMNSRYRETSLGGLAKVFCD